ncbi:MAG: pyrroline-5-carboxylate reductase family protein [Thermodesulfobacteriota bacterium]
MPNIPVTVGQGMTVLTAGAGAGEKNLQTAKGLFQAVGSAITLEDESLIDAVTALSGSGPAYIFFFMEALVQGGIKAGLSAEKARDLVLQTAMGAAAMACKSEHGLAELRRMVTSPGGTTEAALRVFSASDFTDIIEKALFAARDRSEELSK